MGIKYQLKITLGCLEMGKEGKKPRALLLVLCPAQPWRPLPLPFTGGLDGSWWTFPGNFSTFDSPSGFLSVQILSFAPKCAFFFLQSASLTICSTMRSKQGRGFGASGKPLSSLFLRFFFNPGGYFFFWRGNQGFTFSLQTPGAAFGQRCHSRHGALAPFSVMNPPRLLHPRDSGIYKQSLVDHFVFSSVALGSVWRWGWGSPEEAEF